MTQDITNLQEARRRQADTAFAAYAVGRGVTVEATSGWEYTSPGREMSRRVFVRFDDDAPDADTRTAHFTVVFAAKDSREVAEVYALMAGSGNRLGATPQTELHTLVNGAAPGQGSAGASNGTDDFLSRQRRSGRGPAA